MKKTFASLTAALILAGCGGGGPDAGVSPFNQNVSGGTQSSGGAATGPATSGQTGGNPATATGAATGSTPSGAEGFYNGTTSNGFDSAAVILETGEFWGVYARSGVIYGAVHGVSTMTSETTFSGAGDDFYLPTRSRTAATFSGSFTPRSRINGSVDGRGTFVGIYDGSYEVPAKLADVVGTWSGQVVSPAGVQTASVTIDANGDFQGVVNTCTYRGSVRPRASGKAVFDATITFGTGGCLFSGQTLSGISVVNTSGSLKALYTMALLPDGSSGFMSAGVQ